MSAAPKHLRPGQLDALVLAYLRKRKDDGPLTATAIAKGLGGRSAGAVSNCLGRLVKDKKVRQATKAPRAYVVKAKGPVILVQPVLLGRSRRNMLRLSSVPLACSA